MNKINKNLNINVISKNQENSVKSTLSLNSLNNDVIFPIIEGCALDDYNEPSLDLVNCNSSLSL
jgi:hypothetical protein